MSVYHNDSLIVENVKTRLGGFKLLNITTGNYKFSFTNIFGQHLIKEFYVDTTTQRIEICIDEFKETNKTTIFEQLTKTGKLKIFYSSIGCSHFDQEHIVFYYKKSNLYADYYIYDKKKKTKKISDEDLMELILFEKQLREMVNSMGGCTTSDYYTFKLNGRKKLQVSDSSCDWYGYLRMKKEVLGIKK